MSPPNAAAGPKHPGRSCHSPGTTTTQRAEGKVLVDQPCCSPLGILWGSPLHSSPQSHPSPDDGGERKFNICCNFLNSSSISVMLHLDKKNALITINYNSTLEVLRARGLHPYDYGFLTSCIRSLCCSSNLLAAYDGLSALMVQINT